MPVTVVPVMEFGQLDGEEMYDGVWCHASLLHVPRSDLLDALARIHRALKPDGWHYANYKGALSHGAEGGRDSHGRFYSYIAEDALDAVYAAAGPWQSVSRESGMGSSYGGEPTEWHEVFARK
jgi:hypothetical protein